jgi:hypothetical protein
MAGPSWDDTKEIAPSWDNTLDVPKPSELESLARQHASGFMGGFDDEAGGAFGLIGRAAGVKNLASWKPFQKDSHLAFATPTLDPKELGAAYTQNRDALRADQHSDKANPIASAIGQITGGIRGAGFLPAGSGKFIPTVARSATEGAAYGLGNSEADNLSDAGTDTLRGAKWGAVLSWVANVLPRLGNKLGSMAETTAVNSTGATGKQASEFADDAGRQLLDNGYVRFGDSQQNITDRVSKAADDAHTQIDTALKQLDQSGAKVDENQVYNAIRNKINTLRGDPSQADVANKLEKELDNILVASDVRGGDSGLGFQQAEKIKRGYNKMAGNWMDPEKGQAGKSAYQAYRGAVEDAATALNPELANMFESGKKQYGLLEPIQEAAERRAFVTGQHQPGGFLDTTAAVAGGVAGGVPGAILTPIARRFVSPRLSSSSAVTMDELSKILKLSPGLINDRTVNGGNALLNSGLINER